MTDQQWVTKFLEVLDKGIELYTEALETEKGDDREWLCNNKIDDGLCYFFKPNGLPEVKGWIEESMTETYLNPIGKRLSYSRHDRFALRLQILKSIKEQLT